MQLIYKVFQSPQPIDFELRYDRFMSKTDDVLLTVQEAAERSGLSETAIRGALAEKRLPGIRHEKFNRWEIRAADMDAYKERTGGTVGRPSGTTAPKEKEPGE